MAGWLTEEIARHWHPSHLAPLELPARYANAEPGGIPIPDVRLVTQRYIRDFLTVAEQGTAPAFFGRPEVYKTYAAAVIARYVHGHVRLNVEFVNAGAEFLRLGLQRFEKVTGERLDRLSEVPFLVLDDITNVTPKTIAAEFLAHVVSRRFDAQKPTLYTGNYDFKNRYEKFEEEYGPLVARRIARGSKGYLLNIRGVTKTA